MSNSIREECKRIISRVEDKNSMDHPLKPITDYLRDVHKIKKEKTYPYLTLLTHLSKNHNDDEVESKVEGILPKGVDFPNQILKGLGIKARFGKERGKEIFQDLYEKMKIIPESSLKEFLEDKYYYFKANDSGWILCDKTDDIIPVISIGFNKGKNEFEVISEDGKPQIADKNKIYCINIGKKLRDIHCEICKALDIKPLKKDISYEKITTILEKHKQIILQGPPGTGKTRMAKIIAAMLVAGNSNLSLEEDELEKIYLESCERKLEESDGQIKLIQFHPSYGYEDFVMGISVNTDNGRLLIEGRKGAIKEFADKIIEEKCVDKKYVLIIDEINRAPLGTVMGELLYALEKRGEEVQIQSADDKDRTLRIPSNLYIIGTMNTADKSLGSMDYAMRRRFAFINKYSKPLETSDHFDEKLYTKVSSLFKPEIVVEGVNPEDIKLGISYFLIGKNQTGDYRNYKIEYEIVPILREYYKDGYFKKNKKVVDRLVKEIMESNESLSEFLKEK